MIIIKGTFYNAGGVVVPTSTLDVDGKIHLGRFYHFFWTLPTDVDADVNFGVGGLLKHMPHWGEYDVEMVLDDNDLYYKLSSAICVKK